MPPLLPPIWLGPAAAAAAKVFVFDYLPAISTASLAAITLKAVWKRIPDWIKEDVSFRSSNPASSDVERLSTVLKKIQGWMEASVNRLEPVPHVWASFMLYWQMCTLLAQTEAEGTGSKEDCSLGDNQLDDERKLKFSDYADAIVNVDTLKEMLHLATLAYYLDQPEWLTEKLGENWKLLSCFTPDRPGRVGYYAAENDATLLIGIKGTTSLEEILTDACGRSVTLPSDFTVSPVEVQAAQDDQIQSLLEKMDEVEIVSGHERISVEVSSEDHAIRCHEGILLSAQKLLLQLKTMITDRLERGYKLLFVGHSLGGSAASLLALLCRSNGYCRDDEVQVYAFGPPPTLDHDTAVGASSYVTSVVNGSDLVSRFSTANLAVLLECLRQVSERVLFPQKMAPTNPNFMARLLRQLHHGGALWTQQELEQVREASQHLVQLRHPDHLYVPGKLYLLTPDSLRAMDVTALRTIEMDGFRMLGDHTIISHESALDQIASSVQQATTDAQHIC